MRAIGDLPQHRMHDEMARRRVYLHPLRWTSLGLSLLEAMHLGMPVVAVATTEALYRRARVCSTDVERLVRELRVLAAEPERREPWARPGGRTCCAGTASTSSLTSWDDVLDQVSQMHDQQVPAGPRR